MAQQNIGVGGTGNDGTGDTFRSAFTKCNDNFDELYTPDAWVTPTLSNNWVQYGTNWNPFQYRKHANGLVEIRAFIKDGTSSLITTLPVGYRPSKNMYHPTTYHDGAGLQSGIISISTDGIVHATNSVGTAWVTISSLFFEAL